MSLPEGTSSIWSTWAPRSREPSRRPPSCSRLDRPNAARCGQSSQSTLKPWLEGDETIWNHISGTIELESLILEWDKFLDKVGWSISAMSLWLLHPTSTDSHSQLSGQHPLFISQYPKISQNIPKYPKISQNIPKYPKISQNIPKMAFQFTGDQPKSSLIFFGAKNWSPNRRKLVPWHGGLLATGGSSMWAWATRWDGMDGMEGAMMSYGYGWDGWHQQLKMVKISMVEICGNAIDLEMGPYLVTLITFFLTVM